MNSINPIQVAYFLTFGTTGKNVSLLSLLNQIKSGKWADKIQKLRTAGRESPNFGKLKSALPSFVPSGTTTGGRKAADMDQHSGLLPIDIDKVGREFAIVIRDRLGKDPHILAAFLSPGGDGVKALMRIPASIERHKAAFETARTYIEETHGVPVDPSGSDVSRLCFVSHDPDMVLNSDAVLLDIIPTAESSQVGDIMPNKLKRSKTHTCGFDTEAIRNANPLDKFFASRGVKLTATGKVLKGKCPFHNESNGEALVVWPGDRRWKCFGSCNAHGDVIEAVKLLDEVGFKEACERLGATPSAAELPVEAYYDAQQKEYLHRNERGVWRQYSESQFKRILKSHGVSATIPKDERGMPTASLSAIDRVLLELQDRRDVDYHGSLCGKTAGFFEENGTRFLITNSPRLIEPIKGEWNLLNAIIAGLIRDNEPEYGETQWNIFHGWMQTAVRALRAGKVQQAQAFAIAGPPNCGKSLAQQIITPLLSGRAAKAAHFMNGRTDFNGELFEAEHLVLEDEFMSTRISDRLRLGAAIKGMTVSTSLVSCQRKHRHPVNVSAWWRVTISLNDEPEALLVLPPMDEHIADKIILLRASRFDLPMATDSTELRHKFWLALMAEFPAYLHWLMHDFTIPPANSDSKRYVVATWHHPVLRSALDRLSPETELLYLIDRWMSGTGEKTWEGTAERLRGVLTDDAGTRRDACRLIGDWLGACGTYLGRLSKKHPDRVHPARTMHSRNWIIRAEGVTE